MGGARWQMITHTWAFAKDLSWASSLSADTVMVDLWNAGGMGILYRHTDLSASDFPPPALVNKAF